jgi:hypothetical protein
MGLWKKIKKSVKKVGTAVKKTAAQVGKQVKRSVAVASPILLGPGLGEKVGVYVSRTAGKTAKKSTLAGMAKTGRVTGTVVQVVGTAVATYFGGPVAGKAAYAVTGAAKKGGKYVIQKEQYRQGYRTNKPTKPNMLTELISGIGSILGGGKVAVAAGGSDGGGSYTDGVGGGGDPGAYGEAGSSGAAGGGGGGGLGRVASGLGVETGTLETALVLGALLLAAWYVTKGK